MFDHFRECMFYCHQYVLYFSALDEYNPILIIYFWSSYSKVLSIKLSLSSYYSVSAYILVSKDHLVETVPFEYELYIFWFSNTFEKCTLIIIPTILSCFRLSYSEVPLQL